MSDSSRRTGRGVQPFSVHAVFSPGTVAFMIGMCLSEIQRVDQWRPVLRAMPKMMRELHQQPELDLLGIESWGGWRQTLMVQYWRDQDHLMRYASAREHEHLPAWDAFNRLARITNGVGIWHEAYEVQPDTSHILYRPVPKRGMGKATAAKQVEPLVPQAVTSLSSPPGNGGHVATVQAARDDLAVR